MNNRAQMLLISAAGVALLCGALPACRAADIYGTITFEGAPPPEVKIPQLQADANCGKFHKEVPTTHFYKVGPKGGFADVVVSLKGAHGTAASEKPPPW
jgi:hypothetical protein